MAVTLQDFLGKRIALDTAPLIYFIEQNPNFYPKLQPYFESNAQEDFVFITSYLTLLEVMVHPIKQGDTKLARQYQTILSNAQGLEIYPIDKDISYKAAEIRANYNIRTPDAIQIATAIQHQGDYFLTNDNKLKVVKEMDVLVVDDLS